ncbi:MAG: PKD-like domain-containing protein, partial [Bacteroidales bacterium]|nr:PKD-like domain-containing protein [Bacteroidales bacterium]
MNGKYSLFLCTGLFLLAGCNMGRELHNEPAPLIVFDVADGLYSVKTGKTLTITPQVSYDAGASYTWELDGSIVGTDKQYVFSAQLPGTYLLTLRVSRPDITVSKQVRIDV